MRRLFTRTSLVAAAVVMGTGLTLGLTPSSAAEPPDPAPGGPSHPEEPDTDGPANLDTLRAEVRPDGGSERGVAVTFDRSSRTASGEKPAAPSRFVFLFDKSIRFHPERFPTCSAETLRNDGPDACPDDSEVGSGSAEIHGQPGSTPVRVFNTVYDNGMRGVLITLPETGAVLHNTFEPVSAPYRSEYRWASDERIEPGDVPPAERTATTRFTVEFGASRTVDGRAVSFVESTARPGASLRFGLWSEFVTGQVVMPRDEVSRPVSSSPG